MEAEEEAMFIKLIWNRLRRGMVLGLALLGIGLTVPANAAAPPIPPGQARIWFYRIWEPSISLNVANVALNGTPAGSVLPYGTGLYRDVAPGHYHISVASYDGDPGRSKDVDLAPGQEVFAKIVAETFSGSDGSHSSFKRDNFYVWLVSPDLARKEIASAPG
jgi:hypothetical protein